MSKLDNHIKKYYNQYAAKYDQERIKGYYTFINKIEIGIVKEYGKDKKTLEIGCGTGIILNEVSKFSKLSWGVDLSPEMIKVSRNKGLKVKVADATKMPFEDNSFDVIYSFKVLSHIPEISKVIDEVVRVLKPKGISILEYYNPYSFKYISNKLLKSQEKVYTRFDSHSDIKKLYQGKLIIQDTVGARIVSPTHTLYRNSIIGGTLIHIEQRISKTFLNRFAGYYTVVAAPVD